MPSSGSKRGALQSPNPIKHAVADDDDGVDLVSPPSPGNILSAAVTPPFSPAELVSSATVPSDVASPAAFDAAAVSAPETAHGRIPASPSSNRDRFLAGFVPARTCCNLDLCRAPAGNKFNLTAICVAVFPATASPERRYIQLADSTGAVGITVWNSNVAKFTNSTVGRLVQCHKVVIANHNGKKQLTMARDSTIEIFRDQQNSVQLWWDSLLISMPKSCGAVHDISDNQIVSVSGVLGLVSSEIKVVNGVEKTLTCLHLVDATGRLSVRSWNHGPEIFNQYVDRPLLLKRVRVVSFAGTKLCEIIDQDGTVISTDFDGQASLMKFWSL